MKFSELHFGEIPFYLVLCTGRLIILNSKTSEFKCRSAMRKIYCINFTLLSTCIHTENQIFCSDQEMVLTFKKKWCIDFLILSIILPGKHNCYFENNDVNWYITCRYLTTSTMCGSRFFFGEGVWTSSPHPPPRPPPPSLDPRMSISGGLHILCYRNRNVLPYSSDQHILTQASDVIYLPRYKKYRPLTL